DRVGRGVLLVPETPRPDVLEEERNGFHRVLLVRPDDSRRSALDPAGAVDPGGKLVVVMDDATALVADRAASLVEREIRECDGAIPDAAEDETARDRLPLLRRN